MNTIATPDFSKPSRWSETDRLGVVASVLCAIHCALTPILLLLMPAFGKLWSHPASHWGMALFVVPIAAIALARGFRIHRRNWVVGAGLLGIGLILVGAVLPYTSLGMENGEARIPTSDSSVQPEGATAGESEAAGHDGHACEDVCCPSLQANADGGWTLNLPPASIVTTLGGLFLIVTHLGNLCCCSACKKKAEPTS